MVDGRENTAGSARSLECRNSGKCARPMVAAVDPVDGNEVSGEWQKPEVLEQLSYRAPRVRLAEHERYMTVLRLIRR